MSPELKVMYHVKNYLALNHKKSVSLLQEYEYVNFQSFKTLAKHHL